MKVILISGKAQHGKDTLASYIQAQSTNLGILHFANELKEDAIFLGWNGEKDDKGRRFLQQLGDVMKDYHGITYYADRSKNKIDDCNFRQGYIIPDWRLPYEVNPFKDIDVITIRIERPNFDNGLSDEAKSHISETALDDYDFDYVIINDGTFEELELKALHLVSELESR